MYAYAPSRRVHPNPCCRYTQTIPCIRRSDIQAVEYSDRKVHRRSQAYSDIHRQCCRNLYYFVCLIIVLLIDFLTLLRITALAANWYVAQITLPAGKTFHIAVVIADVVRVLVVR